MLFHLLLLTPAVQLRRCTINDIKYIWKNYPISAGRYCPWH